MNRHAIIAKDQHLPVVNIWWGPPKLPEGEVWPEGKLPDIPPDLRATRIWMAAAPADETGPDYACVIAEVYDNDPIQRDRRKIMLDEAIGLDPEGFTVEELERFQIRPHVPPKKDDPNAKLCGCPHCAPTLGEFRRGVVALKDLYRPDLLLVPGTGFDAQAETIQREMVSNRFFRQVVMTEGLQRYDERFEAQYERWFPFQDGFTQIGIMTVREDEVFDKRIVEHHLRAGLFGVADQCKLWHTHPDWHPPARAVQLALARMQDHDLTFSLRAQLAEGELTPGYIEIKKVKDAERRREEELEEEEVRAALALVAGGEAMIDAMMED